MFTEVEKPQMKCLRQYFGQLKSRCVTSGTVWLSAGPSDSDGSSTSLSFY